MIFQRFSQNKYKRKGEKPPTKQPGRSYVRFEKMGEELCLVFSSGKKN
jgi:hypothetical protein